MASEDVLRQRQRRGYWLRLARRQAGLTLKEVASALGYSQRSQTTIKMWEDGKRDPSDIQLGMIADIYGVPVEIFIRPDETDEERLPRRSREVIAERARRGQTA